MREEDDSEDVSAYLILLCILIVLGTYSTVSYFFLILIKSISF